MDKPPKGTKKELEDAMGDALTYMIGVVDYADKTEFPQELIDERKRLDFYGVRGPRRGFSIGYGRSKLWQADVLYILSCTVPSLMLAGKYDVSLKLIQRIRRGEESDWQYEYRLIKRLKTALRGNLKQLKSYNKGEWLPVVYVIKDNHGKPLHYVTSERKAKEYLKDLYDRDDYYIDKEDVLK